MSHFRPLHQLTFRFRIVALAFLAMACISCSSNHDAPYQADAERSPEAMPEQVSEVAPEVAVATPLVSVDATYSDAPKCNALVTRVVEEVVPCIQRTDSAAATRLETTVQQFSHHARLDYDGNPARFHEQMLAQMEQSCGTHWHSILGQIKVHAPQCQLQLEEAN